MTAATSARPPTQRTAVACTVAEHRCSVTALVVPTGAEPVALHRAAGRTLAEPVLAAGDLPAFTNSAMDGYAVRACDIQLGDLEAGGLPVVDEIPAGRGDAPPLVPGTAHLIMTGAPIPLGADTVVPFEATDRGHRFVRIVGPVVPGRHIRRRGEDVAAGETLLPAGIVLTPARLAAAAAAGVEAVAVRRRPRVGVLSAGSELVAPGSPRGEGRVHDTNGLLLCSAVERAGGEAVPLPLVADRPQDLAALLDAYLGRLDLLVTSGGISAGDHEVVKDVLGPRGLDLVRVALRPGSCHGAGMVDGVAVIALPGNPVACWVGVELFVAPALATLLGRAPVPFRRTAPAAVALASAAGRREYLPGVTDPATGAVTPVPAAGPHSYRALAGADCLIELDERGRDVEAGDDVVVLSSPA